MPKGVPNKRYTAEFKKHVIATMQEEGLSYKATARQFEITGHHQIQDWERIYLTEGPDGFAAERRGRGLFRLSIYSDSRMKPRSTSAFSNKRSE